MSTLAPLVVALAQAFPLPSRDASPALPPLKVRATVVSSHVVDLAWRDRTSLETGFEVERRVGSAPFALVASLPADTTTWRDAAALPATSHAYRVRMLTSGGPAAWSDVVKAVTPANLLPAISCSLPQGFEVHTTSIVPLRTRFTVTASDPDGDPVSITLLNPAPGGIFVPVRDAASPATLDVAWPRSGPDAEIADTRHFVFEAHDAVEPDRRVRFVQRVVFVDSYGTTRGPDPAVLAADVTGDGRLDVVAGASFADVAGTVDAGALYVWAGSDAPSGDPTATLTIPASFGSARLGYAVPAGIHLEDVTGDGVLDVVAASTRATVNGFADAGAAFVWEGGATLSGVVAPKATLVSPSPGTGEEIGERPGPTFVDFDGDGVTDLFVGSTFDSTFGGAGELYYWKGGATLSGTPAPVATLLDLRTTHRSPDGSNSSRQVEFVDVTGDGVLDVVVTCSAEDLGGNDLGALRVFDGTTLAGNVAPSATLALTFGSDHDELGFSRYDVPLFADVTGDGMVDVIACSELANGRWGTDAGGVWVWSGGPGLVGSVPPTATLERSFPQQDDFLGESIAVADLTGDGILDVLAGSTLVDFGTTVDCGALFVFQGGAGMTGTVTPRARLFGALANDHLELSALEDLDGDGILDVVMASRDADVAGVVDAGVGAIWRGGANLRGLPLPDATLSATGATNRDEMRLLQRFADLDGDGLVDLVGHTPFASVNGEGAIYLFPCSSGWSGDVHESATLTEPGGQLGRDDLTGGEPVQIGDVTGDGQPDVLACAVNADLGGLVDVGGLYVFAGGPGLSGLVTSTASLEAPGRRKNDWLGLSAGYSFQLVELNGDGILDVVTASRTISLFGIQNCGAAFAWFGSASLSGSVLASARFAARTATKDDALTGSLGSQGYYLVDVTGDGMLDFVTRATSSDWLGVVDVGALRVWKAPFLTDVDPDVTFVVPNAVAGDKLGL